MFADYLFIAAAVTGAIFWTALALAGIWQLFALMCDKDERVTFVGQIDKEM